MEKELTKKQIKGIKILRIFMIVLLVIVIFFFIISINAAIDEKIYKIGEGQEFCENNEMNYTVYLNGEKYCDNGKELLELKYSNGFKFVRRN